MFSPEGAHRLAVQIFVPAHANSIGILAKNIQYTMCALCTEPVLTVCVLLFYERVV